jgi:hypothetical protein
MKLKRPNLVSWIPRCRRHDRTLALASASWRCPPAASLVNRGELRARARDARHARQHVGLWHLADIDAGAEHVRFGG